MGTVIAGFQGPVTWCALRAPCPNPRRFHEAVPLQLEDLIVVWNGLYFHDKSLMAPSSLLPHFKGRRRIVCETRCQDREGEPLTC